MPVKKDTAVSIEGLHKWYGDFHALRDINLYVTRGERVVICGPSGSGKSSLLRCVNRLETHQQGDIHVNGIKLDTDVDSIRKVRQQTSMVFQQFNLFPHLSVLDNLTIGPVYSMHTRPSEAKKHALQLLERVRVLDQAHKFPGQLSGGQQQRVAIARALITNPDILLFDEPTSSLDPEMISEVLDVMVELTTTGITMIVVTHEMGFARHAADLVVFMDEGEILEAAAPDTFFSQPENARTRQFLDKLDLAVAS